MFTSDGWMMNVRGQTSTGTTSGRRTASAASDGRTPAATRSNTFAGPAVSSATVLPSAVGFRPTLRDRP